MLSIATLRVIAITCVVVRVVGKAKGDDVVDDWLHSAVDTAFYPAGTTTVPPSPYYLLDLKQ